MRSERILGVFAILALTLLFARCTVGPAAQPADPDRPADAPTAPTPALQKPDTTRMVEAMRGKLRPVPFAALTTPAPRGPETLVSGQIEITIEHHIGVCATREGTFVVQVHPEVPTTILSIVSTGGPQWSVLNLPGTNVADIQGRKVTPPVDVVAFDALIVASGTGGTPSPRPTSRYATAGGDIDEASGICFVGYPVEDVPLYCPPLCGDARNPFIRGLRGEWGRLEESMADMALLPSVIDFDELYVIPGNPRPGDANRINPLLHNHWRPRIGDLPADYANGWDQGQIRSHRFYAMDIYSEWRCAGRVPYTSHDGYGRGVSTGLSTSHLLLCSTASVQEKAPLAHALVQRGIHDVGRFADGASLYPSGGHCWGRRSCILLMGYLMHQHPFIVYDQLLGDRTPEDQLQPSAWWTGDFAARWAFDVGNLSYTWLGQHPNTWGALGQNGTFAWAVDGYLWHCIGSQLGQVLACVLYGHEAAVQPWASLARAWMATPVPQQVAADLTAKGMTNLLSQFGHGYGPELLAERAWAAYLP